MSEPARRPDLAQRPENLFLVIAFAFGLFFAAVVPPVGGGNEGFNFPRTISVAFGQFLVGPCTIPAGLVAFTDAAGVPFQEGVQPPFGYTAARYHALVAIPLQADKPVILLPNPISVLNPVAYLPQAAALRAGAALGLRPMALFYLSRLTGLLCSVGLTFLALRLLPTRRFTMAAVMLLPPAAYMRGVVDADQITVAVEFLFIALTLSHIVRRDPLSDRELLCLALMAFIAAQCKMAYLMLPILCIAIPRERFRSCLHRLAWLALLILPGAFAAISYLLVVKLTYFAHIQYSTFAGVANPSVQLHRILLNPSIFIGVLLRTIFLTPIVLQSVRDLLGVFGPPISLNPISMLFQVLLLGVIAIADPTAQVKSYTGITRAVSATLFVGSTVFILTLLYLQWNGVGARTILGFQGRYLMPLLPLLAVVPLREFGLPFSIRPAFLLVLTSCAGLLSAAALTLKTYFG